MTMTVTSAASMQRRRRSGLTVIVTALSIASTRTSFVGAASPRIPSGFGPFRVELRGVGPCPAPEQCLKTQRVEISNLEIYRDPNQPWKFTYNADVNMSVPVDDNFKSEMRVSRWTMNGWSNTIFRLSIPNVCSAIKANRPDVFKQLLDAMYDGTQTDCPLPPVNKQLRNFVIETSPPRKVKQLPYGRYRSRMRLLNPTQECVLCEEAILDILPKRKQSE